MIVEQMGGSVNVESKVGFGSTFSIMLKSMCKLPTSRPSESLSDLNKLQTPIPSKSKKFDTHILIVNDEPFLLNGFKDILAEYFDV